jgi:hypothetical protein
MVAAAGDRLAEGRAIYLEGRLPSGEPVTATRAGERLQGAAVACVQCHQRSGMGVSEAAVVAPPVTGPALFGDRKLADHAPRRAPGMTFMDYPFRNRPPHDFKTLARAIREGRYPDGKRLHPLMPRYDLPDDALSSLAAYLGNLSTHPSPGIDERTAHFATVVAPGTDAARSDAMLGVLRACLAERQPVDGQTWQLHVWNLDGPPHAWEAQLAGHYARQPVFALVSGLGLDEWSPVDAFCEARGVPCLFPNAPAPASTDTGRSSFYFSRGAWLEADVFAQYLKTRPGGLRGSYVRQVVGRAKWSREAADSLARGLSGSGAIVETWRLEDDATALDGAGRADILIVWLAADELARLVQRVPEPPAAEVLLSGIYSDMEDAPLNASWRPRVRMAYPYDPPGRWQARMRRNLHPWLKGHGLPRIDDRLQGNTLAACNLLAESMARLRGNYLRDYLLEWVENYPSGMGNAPAPQAYPRFSLGPGQRFSSKGAYLVRFAGPDGHRIEPVEEDWRVP